MVKSGMKGAITCTIKEEDIVGLIGSIVLLTLLVATLMAMSMTIETLSQHQYVFHMYFKPGIYFFTSSGKYYYFPIGKNVTLLVHGGTLVAGNWVYLNSTTIQPGYHYVVVIPIRTHVHLMRHIIQSLPTGALISIIIVMLLYKWLSKDESQKQAPSSHM